MIVESCFLQNEGKETVVEQWENCVILKAKVLIIKFLIQSVRIICVSAISISVMDLNFNPPS